MHHAVCFSRQHLFNNLIRGLMSQSSKNDYLGKIILQRHQKIFLGLSFSSFPYGHLLEVKFFLEFPRKFFS